MKKRKYATGDIGLRGPRGVLAGVLLRAVEDLRSGDSYFQAPAREWFQREAPDEPFSFVWICSELDLSPGAVRRMIRGARPVSNRGQRAAWARAGNDPVPDGASRSGRTVPADESGAPLDDEELRENAEA